MNRHERRAQAAQNRKLTVVNRHCGECTACCTVLGVPELNKPRYTACEHEADYKCGIYAKRPKSCRAFRCIWLQGLTPIDERPDKTGIIWTVTTPKPGEVQYPVAMEIREGAADEEPARTMIARVTERTPVIIVNSSDRRRMVGVDPNHIPNVLRP